jgi:ATP-binding cassette subfamily B (MDR/TAP) protein 1
MFRYADRLGIFLYAVGMVCMAASGTALPLLDLIFGQFVNTFNVSPEQELESAFLTLC